MDIRALLIILAALGMAVGCHETSGHRMTGPLPEGYAGTDPIRLEDSLVIGEESGVIFGSVLDVAVDREERIYVADGEYQTIRVFSSEGDSLTKVGCKGQGPGEFTGLYQIMVGPEDSLFAYDVRQSRLTAFGPNPSYERGYTRSFNDLPDVGSPSNIFKPDTTGFLVTFSDRERTVPVMEGTSRMAWLSSGGQVRRDSLVIGPVRQHGLLRDGERLIMLTLPFARRPIYRVGSENRIYYAWSDSARVTWYSLDGRQLENVSFPAPSIRTSSQEIERYIEERPESFKGFVETYYDAHGFSETHPPLEDFQVDAQRRLWINLQDTSQTRSTWRIVDPPEKTVATVVLPENLSIEAVRHGRIYGVRRYESGLQELVVYQM